jgi:hypothetical protein
VTLNNDEVVTELWRHPGGRLEIFFSLEFALAIVKNGMGSPKCKSPTLEEKCYFYAVH